MEKYKVLFADLDGTLIETLSGETFPKGIWDMKFKSDVLDSIKNLAPEWVVIVTNQGGIEKGLISSDCFEAKIQYVAAAIEEYTDSTVIYDYCPYYTQDYYTRKPKAGMLADCMCNIRAMNKANNIYEEYQKSDMLMIGDASGKPGQWSDTDKKTAENFDIDYLDVEDFVRIYSQL